MSVEHLDRLDRAMVAIDAANAEDPHRIVVDGAVRPKELAHAELVSAWVRRLAPDASEPLLLAARAHHLRRWELPRSSHPTGRVGYLRWRRTLHERHAADVAEILAEVGYEDATVERVQDLVRKRELGRDPEVQVLEDALCLVFVETQLADFARRTEPATLRRVIEKTAAKMSDGARRLVPGLVAKLDVPPEARSVLDEALDA